MLRIYTPQKPSQTAPNRSFAPSPAGRLFSEVHVSVGKRSSSPSRRDPDKVEEEAEGGQQNGGDVVQEQESSGGKKSDDQRRYSRCFSGLELSIGPGPLKDVDAGKLKGQIRKWARAVVSFARQLSFGSPRSSPRLSGDGTTPTPRSKSKSGRGSARGDDPPRAQLPP